MHKLDSLRWRLLWNLTLMLVVLMLASSLSAYYNGREAADTAYDRTLLASARTIAAGLSQRDGSLSADMNILPSRLTDWPVFGLRPTRGAR